MAEHEIAVAEARLECRCDIEERGEGRTGRLVGLWRGMGTPDHEHQPASLHADQHIGIEVSGGTAQHVDIEHLRGGAHQHRDLAVSVPAEGGNA